MISDETKRKLRELNLDELIDILGIQDNSSTLYTGMAFDERLNMAIDSLYQQKNNSRAKRLMKQARFPFSDADVNTIYYADRGLDKNQIIELATCWKVKHEGAFLSTLNFQRTNL